MENMRRMDFNPASIDKIALGHGHGDHTASVSDVLSSMNVFPAARRWQPGTSLNEFLACIEGHRVPIIAHPADLTT
jgi:metal-dependent hydrolase (beta-lactamase superfamily II)